MSTFILKKDTPTTKAGIRFTKISEFEYQAEDNSDKWDVKTVENTPEWWMPEVLQRGKWTDEDVKDAIEFVISFLRTPNVTWLTYEGKELIFENFIKSKKTV
jgi:hypothetical protein